jgi:hypothetical protein
VQHRLVPIERWHQTSLPGNCTWRIDNCLPEGSIVFVFFGLQHDRRHFMLVRFLLLQGGFNSTNLPLSYSSNNMRSWRIACTLASYCLHGNQQQRCNTKYICTISRWVSSPTPTVRVAAAVTSLSQLCILKRQCCPYNQD